jgi:hypothetical protein
MLSSTFRAIRLSDDGRTNVWGARPVNNHCCATFLSDIALPVVAVLLKPHVIAIAISVAVFVTGLVP